MAMRRAACSLQTFLLTFFLFCVVLSATGLAQPPSGLYQTGPDPIAPELHTSDAGPDSQRGVAADEKKEEEDKDDLGFLEKTLSEISRTQVASTAMDMEVSTVSRTESSVGKSPTAVYVIT
ncbi:MAG: hypothetical protein JW888_18420, partial [Pirellulales bacterium]|nr:hypothetical protein [Pirellulales bacterium]